MSVYPALYEGLAELPGFPQPPNRNDATHTMAILASNTTPCSPLSMLNIIPGANMAEHWCATTVISNATIPLMQECCGSWQEVYNHDDYTWCNIAWPDAKNNSDFTLSFSRCREVNAEERKVARPGVWRCNTPRFEPRRLICYDLRTRRTQCLLQPCWRMR